MVKLKVDYNEETERPELGLVYNTPDQGLEEKMLRRFVELSADPELVFTATSTPNENGTTTVKLAFVTPEPPTP